MMSVLRLNPNLIHNWFLQIPQNRDWILRILLNKIKRHSVDLCVVVDLLDRNLAHEEGFHAPRSLEPGRLVGC